MPKKRAPLVFSLLLWMGATGTMRAGAATWEGPATIGVELKDRAGTAVPGAVIRLRLESGTGPVEATGGPLPARTDGAGTAAFGGLAEGEWFVEISHPDFMSFTAYVVLRAGKAPKTGFTAQVTTASSSATMRVAFVKPRTVPPRAAVVVVERPPSPPSPLPPGERGGANGVGPAPPPKAVSPPAAPPAPPPAPVAAPLAPAPVPPTPTHAPPAIAAPAIAAPAAVAPAVAVPAVAAPATASPAIAAPAAVAPAVAAPAVAAPAVAAPTVAAPASPALAAPVIAAPLAAPAPPPSASPPPPTPPPTPASPPPPALPAPPAPLSPLAAAPASSSPPALLRSADRGNCPECRPGESALSIESVAAVVTPDCELALTSERAAATNLVPSPTAGLGIATRSGPAGGSCQLFSILLPLSLRYLGYRYEAEDRRQTGDCAVDADCAVGAARFRGHPALERQRDGTLVTATFENHSTEMPRTARLTVYFRAQGSPQP